MDKAKLKKIKEDILNQFKKEEGLDFTDFVDSKNYEIIKSSGLFDENYYFDQYPDVKLCEYDPIEHYITVGCLEYCNPNNDFDTEFYLFNNPDVAKSEFNPFVHYILYGVHENRVAKDKNIEEHFVSVILSIPNENENITDVIDSALNQTFKNFEIIIVDNKSGGNSEDYIKRKFRTFINLQKIKYFKTEYDNESYAKNFGLKKAKGDFIAYLDSTTLWNKHYLEYMLKELEGDVHHDCAYCDLHIINKQGKNSNLNREFDRKRLFKENFIDLNCFINKRELFKSKGGFDEEFSSLEDWDLIIRYTENKPPLFVNKNLAEKTVSKQNSEIPDFEKNKEKIQVKNWKEIYLEEYESIRDDFDQDYYLSTYEDVLTSGMSPICHYLIKGHDEGKNPHPEFVTSYYVNKYGDVVRAGYNTFYHFVNWGDAEGRENNYFKRYNELQNNNLLQLSNYTFDKEPLVSILILNRNGIDHLKTLFKDFDEKTNYSNYEIVVVDNASEDESVAYMKSLDLPITVIENKENVSFAQGNNDAAKKAKGEYYLLLNNDMEPTYGWLNEMMGTIIYNENVGSVGAKLIYPYISDDRATHHSFSIQHAGDILREENGICVFRAYNQNKFLEDIFDNEISHNRKCLLVTGAALLTKKSIYEELNGLDERFWYGYEDVDYNLKVNEKGYDTIFASAALLFHHESATRKREVCITNYEILRDKWTDFLSKRVLKDKIEQNKFFTDQDLKFTYVIKHDLTEDSKRNEYIQDLSQYLKKQNYKMNLKLDADNFDVDDDVDIIISFSQDYEVKYIRARENVIKILVMDEAKLLEGIDSYNCWDIIITDDKPLQHELTMKYEHPSAVYLDDYSKLGETIISSLYSTFIDN